LACEEKELLHFAMAPPNYEACGIGHGKVQGAEHTRTKLHSPFDRTRHFDPFFEFK
jgi:hypothetical protein